jgi:hypothetical protein
MTEAELFAVGELDVQPEECKQMMVTAFCPACRVQVFEYLSNALAEAIATHLNLMHGKRGREC